MIALRGQKKLGPGPDWSPLGVLFKISDEHPYPFHMRSSPRDCLLMCHSACFSSNNFPSGKSFKCKGPRSKGIYLYVERYYYQETEALRCPTSMQYNVTYVETRK